MHTLPLSLQVFLVGGLLGCAAISGSGQLHTSATATGIAAPVPVDISHGLPEPDHQPGEPLSIPGWNITLLPAGYEALQASRDGSVVLLRKADGYRYDPDAEYAHYRWNRGNLERLGQGQRASMSNSGAIAMNLVKDTFYQNLTEFTALWRPTDQSFGSIFLPPRHEFYYEEVYQSAAYTVHEQWANLVQLDDQNRAWVHTRDGVEIWERDEINGGTYREFAGRPSAARVAPSFAQGYESILAFSSWEGVSRNGHSIRAYAEYRAPETIYYVDEVRVSSVPFFINDNGVALLRDHGSNGALFVRYPNGAQEIAPRYQPPTAIGAYLVYGYATWIDSQDRLGGYEVMTSPATQSTPAQWSPALLARKLDGNGQPIVPAVYEVIPCEPMIFPAGWTTDHLVAPGTLTPQLGIAVSSADGTRRPFVATPRFDFATLAVDTNRDGRITLPAEDHSDVTSAERPYRFWVNDDDDVDAMNGDDIPAPSSSSDGSAATNLDGDGAVDGVRDLEDFFPVFLDIKGLLAIFPPSGSIRYKLKQTYGALNFVYTKLTRADASKYQTQDFGSIFGPNLNQPIAGANTQRISAAGVELTPQFLAGVKDNDWCVILVEASIPTTQPLVLSVEKSDGAVLAEIKLPLNISSVEDMYRWVNLRDVAGQTIIRPTNIAEPSNSPDRETNGKMFVMVHGYNVNERDSRGWGAETFKRLYWSGSRAMFAMVSWHGDHSRIPYVGISPDYWQNINHAFLTSQALPAAIASLPGSSKIIAGHSMGNVVVSSAIADHGLSVAQYFMLDAAVALEAYDATAMSIDAMRHPDWAQYETRLWPSAWHKLFPAGDGRRGLTWVGRFGNIANATNFYSSGEDVLNNNDTASGGTPGQIPSVLGAERKWVLQEMVKGTNHPGAVLTFDVQGGWGFASRWDVPTFVPDDSDAGGHYVYNRRTPAQAAALTDEQLRTLPFFLAFQDTRFLDANAGGPAAAEYAARADALGGAIPALSFAAGRNPVPVFENDLRNVDLMTLKDGWPRTGGRWFHSDAKNIAYRFNHKLWDAWIELGDLK